MSGVTFLSTNHFDSATISLTTGTENAQFPLENLKNDSPSIKFRGVGNTSVILIDLLVTQDIDYIAVAADPLESFVVNTISVKTSTTTDFSLSTSYPLDLSQEQTIGFVKIPEVSHRYVQLTITATGGFTELGKVFVGKGLNIPLNSFSIGSFSYGYKDRSDIRENKYGQRFIDKLNQVKSLAGKIEYCTQSEQQELDDMMIYHGKSLPIWLILDEESEAITDGKFKLTMYGYFTSDNEWSAAGGQLYNLAMELRQAI